MADKAKKLATYTIKLTLRRPDDQPADATDPVPPKLEDVEDALVNNALFDEFSAKARAERTDK